MSLVSAAQGSGGELQFVPYTIFPNAEMRVLSATIHLVGSSTLAYCVARRVGTVRVAPMNDLKTVSWPRFCVLMTLVISWMFIVGTGILIHGVGLSSSQSACSSGVFMCIWLYALTKVFIYAFLSEKVRVVWDVVAQPRLKSPVYLICLLFMLPVFLNAMFLWPLLRSKLINPRLRAVARRTLGAAVAALATSITNVAILTALKHELGWVCLGSCATDVTLNALVLFWVTMPTADCFSGEPATWPGQLPEQQQSFSQNKADTEHIAHKPTLIKTPIVIFASMVHKPRSLLNTTVFGKTVNTPVLGQPRITEAHELQYTPTLPDFPVSPTVASTSVGNLSMLANSPGDESNSGRKSTGLRSLGELFGLSKHKLEQDMEVHVSVVTQHDVELGELESGRTKQDDGDSLDQIKQASEWYK